MANLRQTLHAWRDQEAAKKGIELFRVLPNSAIDDIVRALPKTKEELTAIKGIKDAKFLQYGMAILSMVKEAGGVSIQSTQTSAPDTMTAISYIADGIVLPKPKEERVLFSVSSYLDIVNRELWRMRATVKGEVTSFKEQGKAVYFSLRDALDGSTLSVFMWLSDFTLSGITLVEGIEVILEGRSEIYKPSGRFSFKADTIELAGEGAFQKAYNELKNKLTAEGIFSIDKKRALAPHPIRIGLVTSRSGAVIHDFLNNLGRFGFEISFVDARVEGAGAVKEILSAIAMLKEKSEKNPLDVLVLIRGGGSLESLQAFNNEYVVRAIANFPATTICAIGHDKDVPLAQLAADYAPSTPTAGAVLLNESWEASIHEIERYASSLQSIYESELASTRSLLRNEGDTLARQFAALIQPFRNMALDFRNMLLIVARALSASTSHIENGVRGIVRAYERELERHSDFLERGELTLKQSDPMRQLRLGYSIVRAGGALVRSVSHIKPNERFEVRLCDGTLEATATSVSPLTDHTK